MSSRTIDAVKVPLGYGAGRGPIERLRSIAAEFSPLLGGGKVYIRHGGTYLYVAPDVADTLLFPTDHPKAKQDRYTWVDRGDGVRVGTLVPDDSAAGPSEDERRQMTETAVGKLRAMETPHAQ